jgi:hypothetical protein
VDQGGRSITPVTVTCDTGTSLTGFYCSHKFSSSSGSCGATASGNTVTCQGSVNTVPVTCSAICCS